MFNKKKYNKEYNKDHPEYNKEYTKQWRKDNREHINEYHKQYRKDNPEHTKQYLIRYKYGLSHEEWLKMWEIQDGQCVICGKPFQNPSDACVDHNHDTKEVRGLLCRKCNFGIGYFNDDPELMAEAIEYLLRLK